MSEFRLQLRPLRQAKTLSQEELAEALGISRQSIISLEHGEYLPSFPLLVEMIRFFDCPIDQLVTGLPIINRQYNQNKEGGDRKMPITQWNPFQMLDRVHNELEEAIERNFSRADWSKALGSVAGAMNIQEDEKEYQLSIQAPGFTEDEVAVEVANDTLTVSGRLLKEESDKPDKVVLRREWEKSEFTRTVRFAQPVKGDKAEAKMTNGTLTIILPKLQPIRPKSTTIAVKKN